LKFTYDLGDHITLNRLGSNQIGSERSITTTERNGFTHFWTSKSGASRSGWARILEDNDVLNGMLSIHTHWGVIPVEVKLAGEKCHYILVRQFRSRDWNGTFDASQVERLYFNNTLYLAEDAFSGQVWETEQVIYKVEIES
jgi:hypothetical protein